jgi:hypothetical protein
MSNRKNVIILVLSHYEEPYVMLENCIKQTWANHNLDNVKVFFYHGGEDECIYEDKIITNYPEGSHNIGYKTIRAFEILLKNNNFDYIFRTNSSSYVNIDKLVDYLDDKPVNEFYHGIVGNHGGINFASGCGYFISKDLVEKVVENKNKWNHRFMDDVSLACLLRDIGIYPTISKRLDITHTPVPDNIFDYFHFRCKTSGDRIGDVRIMNELKSKLKNKSI